MINFFLVRDNIPTVNTTAQYLCSEADGPVEVPGLRVDADESGHSGDREESQHRGLWILVSFKDLNKVASQVD